MKNIYKRSDGRWEARVNLGKDDSGKNLFKSFYGKTKSEAHKKMEEFIQTNLIGKKKYYKFSDICNAWLAEKKKILKPSSVSRYESNLEKYILPYFGDTFYWDANSMENGFLESLKSNSKISNNFAKELVTLYRSIINWYKKDQSQVSTERDKVKLEFFTDDEMKKIEKMLDSDSILFAILFYTGISLGELIALKWSDCDLDSGIKINKTIQRVPVSSSKETSKTRLMETTLPERLIPISPELKKIMQSVPKCNQKGYISGGKTPTDTRTVQYQFKHFLHQINLNGSPNVIRDSFAIQKIKKGLNPLYIADIMGIKWESFIRRYRPILTEVLKSFKTL